MDGREVHGELDRRRLIALGRIRFEAAKEAVARFGADAVVTYVVRAAAERADPTAPGLHRDVAELIQRIGKFEPDVSSLLILYRRAARHSATRVLVAWTLSRPGMEWLAPRLADLADGDPGIRTDAAELLSEAEKWAGSDLAPTFSEPRAEFPDLTFPGEVVRGERRERPEAAAEPVAAEPDGVPTGLGQVPRRPPPPPQAAPPPPEAAPPSRLRRLFRFPRRRSRAPRVLRKPAERPAGDRAVSAEPPEPAPRDRAVAAEPPEEVTDEGPRWLLAKTLDASSPEPREVTKGFRANAPHDVVVMVATPREGWKAAVGASPDESVDAKLQPEGTHDLTVMFFVPSLGEVQTGTISLPPIGASNQIPFRFTAPPAGQRVDATISLLYESRVLQTAILSGWSFEDPALVPQGFEMTFRLAVIRPGTAGLEGRQPFDAALVTGPTDKGPTAVAVHSGPEFVTFDSERLPDVVNKIRSFLDELADDPDLLAGGLGGEKAVEWLRKLAFKGRDLYEVIGSKLEKAMAGRELARIQLVLTDPSDFIPMEFLYDFPPPALDAGICPNWKQALKEGTCDPANHPPASRRGTVSTVCPLGFWTLKKVIERQVIDADDEASLWGKDFGIRAEPTAERPRLDDLTAALVAWSDLVEAKGRKALVRALGEATADRALAVHTWEDWVAAIPDRRPSLLVLLSHTVTEQDSPALEIGPDTNGSRCLRVQLVPEYVKSQAGDAPLVLLLGCDTAVARMELQTFVARFRDLGAALVVGTVAPVLADHAATVAAAVVRQLRAAIDDSATGGNGTFGEAMLRVRRSLLGDGELTALCITAFGDADWRVGAASGGG
jgi:hypothetical protein